MKGAQETTWGANIEVDATLRHLVFEAMHRLVGAQSPRAPFVDAFNRLAGEQGSALLRADNEHRMRL
jgi:hypothetical protein